MENKDIEIIKNRDKYLFVDNLVKIKWVSANKKYYESLGYIFTKFDDPLYVHPWELQRDTKTHITVKCPSCGNLWAIKWGYLLKRKDSLCHKCVGVFSVVKKILDVNILKQNPNFILISETVFMKWNAGNQYHYTQLDYPFTKQGDIFEVKVSHLPIESKVKVKLKCPICDKIWEKSWNDITKRKNPNSICHSCKDKNQIPRLLNNPDFIFLQRNVDITWQDRNKQYYIRKGYPFTKKGDSFTVTISDLNPGSCVKIWIQCPCCKEKRHISFKEILSANHTLCGGCCRSKGYLKNAIDLTGMRFGKLTVLKRSERDWFFDCICDCGNTKEVHYKHLKYNVTKSCGCLHAEVLKSWTGEKHPNWDFEKTEEERIKRREFFKNKVWKASIRGREFCELCNSKTKLHAHHLNAWKFFKEDRFKEENGVCLCEQCHNSFHAFYGRKGDSTKEQFEEFKKFYNRLLPKYMLHCLLVNKFLLSFHPIRKHILGVSK